MSDSAPLQPEPLVSGAVFATTHWSLVLRAGRSDSAGAEVALETLFRAYWPPIFAFIRRSGHPPESARDLTQEFFTRLLEKDWLHRAEREQGRFRSFLLTYLKRFLSDQRDRESAQKRGGVHGTLSLDELMEAGESMDEPSTHLAPDLEFDRRWAVSTLENALSRLRAEAERAGCIDLFTALQGHLDGQGVLERQTEIAGRFGLSEGALKMRLNRWRTRFRELIRAEVAQTVPKAADVEAELRHLMAALVN